LPAVVLDSKPNFEPQHSIGLCLVDQDAQITIDVSLELPFQVSDVMIGSFNL
jgi:hypothetical protein